MTTQFELFATTASEAWEQLISSGLEMAGRDEDLVDMLRTILVGEKLAQENTKLESLLINVSLEEFVRAFFQAATPYVDMLKDILKWFEKAHARQGPEGWKLAWDGADMEELKNFRQWMAKNETRDEIITYRAMTYDDCWKLLQILENIKEVQATKHLIFQQNYRDLPLEAREFAFSYHVDCYDSIESIPKPPVVSKGMSAMWNIIRRVLSELIAKGLSRKDIHALVRSGNHRVIKDNGFAASSIYSMETDLWLLRLVSYYGTLFSLSDARRDAELAILESWLATLPEVSYLEKSSVESLSEFINLPLWKKRHEFYSAWIASRIIDACDGHEMNLLHEKGVISLPFKKTVVAEIATKKKHVLMSEVRTKLEDPTGKGRKEGVQPDFSVWHGSDAEQICDLVVEVKHYQRPAKKSWVAVFNDYAAAHADAKVVLVNYGNAGSAHDALKDVDVKKRCQLIGNLRPGQMHSLQQLEATVKVIVGKPPRKKNGPVAVMVDMSYSTMMDADILRDIIHEQVARNDAATLGVATSAGNLIWNASEEATDQVIATEHNAEGDFTDILSVVLENHVRVIFITDDEGRLRLYRDVLEFKEISGNHPDQVKVLEVVLKE